MHKRYNDGLRQGLGLRRLHLDRRQGFKRRRRKHFPTSYVRYCSVQRAFTKTEKPDAASGFARAGGSSNRRELESQARTDIQVNGLLASAKETGAIGAGHQHPTLQREELAGGSTER